MNKLKLACRYFGGPADLVDLSRMVRLRRFINIIKRQTHTESFGKSNDPSGDLRRHGLAFFVMRDVSLRHIDALSKRRLSDAKPHTYRFDLVHTRILAPLFTLVNSGAVMSFLLAGVI